MCHFQKSRDAFTRVSVTGRPGLVGAIVDSAVFLLLAFGNLAYLEGLIVGKLWASLAAFGLLIALRRRGEIDV